MAGRVTWEDQNAKGKVLSREAVKDLLGGKWPNDPDGFEYSQVFRFRQLSPGYLQGFSSDGEPIGPAIQFKIINATVSIEELFT